MPRKVILKDTQKNEKLRFAQRSSNAMEENTYKLKSLTMGRALIQR
jgi:hypothetical protein